MFFTFESLNMGLGPLFRLSGILDSELVNKIIRKYCSKSQSLLGRGSLISFVRNRSLTENRHEIWDSARNWQQTMIPTQFDEKIRSRMIPFVEENLKQMIEVEHLFKSLDCLEATDFLIDRRCYEYFSAGLRQLLSCSSQSVPIPETRPVPVVVVPIPQFDVIRLLKDARDHFIEDTFNRIRPEERFYGRRINIIQQRIDTVKRYAPDVRVKCYLEEYSRANGRWAHAKPAGFHEFKNYELYHICQALKKRGEPLAVVFLEKCTSAEYFFSESSFELRTQFVLDVNRNLPSIVNGLTTSSEDLSLLREEHQITSELGRTGYVELDALIDDYYIQKIRSNGAILKPLLCTALVTLKYQLVSLITVARHANKAAWLKSEKDKIRSEISWVEGCMEKLLSCENFSTYSALREQSTRLTDELEALLTLNALSIEITNIEQETESDATLLERLRASFLAGINWSSCTIL